MSRADSLRELARLFTGAAALLEAQADAEPAPSKLLRYREVAERLACNRSTVARLVARRALALVMVGAGSPRVTSESVDALIARGGLKASRPRGSSLLREVSR